MRTAPLFLLVSLLGLSLAPAFVAGDGPGGVAPQDARNGLLLARAVRVGRNVETRHLSPEGLLAHQHRKDATPAQLSADVLRHADTAIWAGCYAASVACRYAVTREPEALALAKRCAAGLDLLSSATGVPGCISRAAGRPIAGEEAGRDVQTSPLGGGLAYRGDPSRDTLAGVVLGWECLARFVEDAEVRAYASKNLGALARRLKDDGMHLKDVDGKTTTYGSLDPKVAGVLENGMHAAIGLATIQAGLTWSPGQDLEDAWRALDRRGWFDAVDSQWTWLGTKVTSASNMNMVHLSLLTLALEAKGKPQRKATDALREFRRKTHGWQNGAYLSIALLAGQKEDRAGMVEELRETLLAMRPEEVPWRGAPIVTQSFLVPIERRPVDLWLWKIDPHKEQLTGPETVPDPVETYSRADWLFAYWLGRAAGELVP